MDNKMIHKIDSIKIGEAEANEQQKSHFEISPSGYGIHWPDIDEDLAIDSLIGVRNSAEKRPSQNKNTV